MNSVLRFALFIAPIIFFLGIALQAFSLFFLAIIIPFVFTLVYKIKMPKVTFDIGIILIVFYSLFPLISLFNFYELKDSLNLSFHKGLLKSSLSSSFLISGILLVTSFKLNQLYLKKTLFNTQQPITSIIPLKSFLLGLFFASIFTFCYCLFQHLTGFSLKAFLKNSMMDISINGSRYHRAYGGYGHPLTLASVCLAYSSFSWSLFCVLLFKKLTQSLISKVYFNRSKNLTLSILLGITVLNSAILALTMSKVAIIINFSLIFFIFTFFTLLSQERIFRKLLFIFIFFLIFIFGLSILQRNHTFKRLKQTYQNVKISGHPGKDDNRLKFWEVYISMIKDRWLSGYGSYIIRKEVRNNYYDKLGYSKLSEKFNAHNNYLEILADIGVLGTALFILIMIFLFVKLRKSIFNKSIYLKIFFLPFLISFMANLTHSLTQNVFYDSSVTYIYLYFLILLVWSITFENTNKKAISSLKPKAHQM